MHVLVEMSNVYISPTTRDDPFKIRKRVGLKPAYSVTRVPELRLDHGTYMHRTVYVTDDKGTDQAVQMHRPISVPASHIWYEQAISWRGSHDIHFSILNR